MNFSRGWSLCPPTPPGCLHLLKPGIIQIPLTEWCSERTKLPTRSLTSTEYWGTGDSHLLRSSEISHQSFSCWTSLGRLMRTSCCCPMVPGDKEGQATLEISPPQGSNWVLEKPLAWTYLVLWPQVHVFSLSLGVTQLLLHYKTKPTSSRCCPRSQQHFLNS